MIQIKGNPDTGTGCVCVYKFLCIDIDVGGKQGRGWAEVGGWCYLELSAMLAAVIFRRNGSRLYILVFF